MQVSMFSSVLINRLCMCFCLHVGLHCVYALPCMVKYLRMCSNLETANHVSCGLARHLMVDKFLTHDYHVLIN